MAERKEVVTAEFVANLHSSFKRNMQRFNDQIRALKAEVDSLNGRLGQTGKAIAKDYGQNIKAASAETQRFGSLVKKFGADTVQGFKSALPYFTTMAKGATKGGEALEKANRMATNYVHGLKDLQGKLSTVGKGFAHNDQTLGKWGNSVKAAGIRQGELAGALKITSNGIKMLTPEAQRYLNLTNSQYKALQKLEGRSQGYVQSMQKVWNQTKGNVAAFNDKVKSLDKADKAIARTATTMNKAGKDGQRYYETASRLTVANNMMTKGFIDANGNIAAVANNMGRGVKQASMFQRAVMGIVDSFKSMARYAAGAMIFYQLFNLFRSATQSMIDFSQGMKDLQAIINATDEDIYKLGETVKVVAANTKYSTTEVAEGMKLLGQAGLSTAEIIQSVEYVAQLATGTMTDFATVSDLMTTTIRAFQLDFLESGRVADVFANAINRSKLTVEKLKVAFNYLAPLAKSANITFEETSASLMMLANAGIRASTMGTGMRQILIRLINPTTQFAEAIEAAGYSTREFNPLHNDLADIFDRLSVVVPTAAEAIRFFHVRSLPAVMVFASQSGVALREFMKEIEEVGAAMRMMTTQTEGLGIKFKQVADRFSVFSVALGQSGVDTFIHVVADAMRGLLAVMTSLVEKGFTSIILGMGATVTAIYGLIGAFKLLKMQAIGVVLFGWVGALAAFTMELKVATVAIYKQVGAVAALRTAWLALSTVPISAWIIGISAAIVGIITAIKRWSNSTENMIRKFNEKREAAETTAAQLALYREKIEEAAREGKPFLHFLERAIEEMPQFRRELIGLINDVDSVIKKFKELEDFEKVTALEEAGKAAVRAAGLYKKYNRVLEQSNKEFIDWYEREGEPGLFNWEFYKFDKAREQLPLQEKRMELFVKQMIAHYREQGEGWDELQKKIVIGFLDQGNEAIKHLQFFTAFSEAIVAQQRKQEEEMIAQQKRLPHHLEKIAKEHEDLRDELQKIYGDYTDDIMAIGQLDIDTLGEDFVSEQTVQRIRELERAISDVIGVTFKLDEGFDRINRLIDEMPSDIQGFRLSLGAVDKHSLDNDIQAIVDRYDKMREDLKKNAELTSGADKDLRLRQEREILEAVRKFREEEERKYSESLAEIRMEGYDDKIQDMEKDLALAEAAIKSGRYKDEELRLFEHEKNKLAIRLKFAKLSYEAGISAIPDEELKNLLDFYDTLRELKIEGEVSDYEERGREKTKRDEQDAFNDRMSRKQMEIDYINALAKQETNDVAKINMQHQANLLSLEISHARKMREAKEINYDTGKIEELTKAEAEYLENKRKEQVQSAIDTTKATEYAERKEINELNLRLAERTKSRREAFEAEKRLLEDDIAYQLSLHKEGSELYKQIEENGYQDVLDLTKDFNEENKDLIFERQAILAEASQDEVRIIETNFEHKKALLQRERDALAEHLEDSLVAWEWYYIELRKLEEERDNAITKETGTSWENFRLGLEEAAGEMASFNDMMFKIGNESVDVLVDGFAEMWSSFVTGTKSAKEAMADFAQSTLKWLTEIILKQMILNAISGFFNKGGPVTTGRSSPEGGVSNFSSGGKIEGFSKNKTEDNILAKVTAGEYVLKVDAVKHYGEDFINALNSLQVPKFAKGGIVGNSLPQKTTSSQPDKMNFVMNVENKSGADVHMEQPSFDGVRWVANMFITAASNNVSGVRDLLSTR